MENAKQGPKLSNINSKAQEAEQATSTLHSGNLSHERLEKSVDNDLYYQRESRNQTWRPLDETNFGSPRSHRKRS